MMKGFTTLLIAVAFGFGMAQTDLAAMSSQQIVDKIDALQLKGPETHAEQVKLLWLLVQRSGQNDGGVHKVARQTAERVMAMDQLNPRARYAFGYFRAKESWDTIDPILRKRRLDEGKRHVGEALKMGTNDPTFLFDAGMLAIALPSEANMYREGMNALVIVHRTLGESFSKLPKERQSDWFVAMANGFDMCGIPELARDYYRIGLTLAPDTASGKRASTWLKANGDGG